MFYRFLIGCLLLTASASASEYFVLHTVSEMNGNNFTLDDGSQWQVNSLVNPLFKEGSQVWIMPVMQMSPSAAVMLDIVFTATSANLVNGSTAVTITGIDNGVVTLSDNSQWQLDSYYQKYTSMWQEGDTIIYGGRKNSYYLINGNMQHQDNPGATYSLATKVSSG